jgi:hypothetical protein
MLIYELHALSVSVSRKTSLISVQLSKQKHSTLTDEPSVLSTVYLLQIQLHSIIEKLKIPERKISLITRCEGDDIKGGLCEI